MQEGKGEWGGETEGAELARVAYRNKEELGISGAMIGRHLGDNTSSINSLQLLGQNNMRCHSSMRNIWEVWTADLTSFCRQQVFPKTSLASAMRSSRIHSH